MTATQARGSSEVIRDRAARTSAAAVLAGLGVLHVAWGRGSSWPCADRELLAEAVLGVTSGPGHPASRRDPFPSPSACYAVAGALAGAAGVVGGAPLVPPAVRRLGVRCVVGVLGVRGVLGVTGLTRLAVPVATGPVFVRLDRRVYGPLCLLLAACSSRALLSRERASGPG